MAGAMSSTSPVQIYLDLSRDHDQRRFGRLAQLLFSPSTLIVGSTGQAMGISS